jgi:hypothetical protein
MLGAYYYLWYGKPTPPILGMGEWQSGYSHQPVLGEYNSRDLKTISRHLIWAKEGGIDFFSVDWLGPGTWEDITLRDYYLLASKDYDVKFCIHYNSSFALNKFRLDKAKNQVSFDFQGEYLGEKKKGEKLLDDFDYLADNYFNHPQYLKIGGRPLVIVYNASVFQNAPGYLEKLKANMAKRKISLFLIGDAVYWGGVKISKNILPFLWQTPPEEAIKVFYRAMRRNSPNAYEKDSCFSRYFSGITGYNLFNVSRVKDFLKNTEELYRKFWDYAKSQNICFVPSIMPGYNDRNLKGQKRPVLERGNDGEFYKGFWHLAQKYLDPSLNMVLITSFNEWHEGTEIEPSREYDTQYLELSQQKICQKK